MCRYCVEYGNGTKWYLNPDNFKKELLSEPGHKQAYEALMGAGRNIYEWGNNDKFDETLSDIKVVGPALTPIVESTVMHAGQVVPLEDTIKIIEIAPGDRLFLQHCGCRRYIGHKDFYGCMFFDTAMDKTLQDRPWETDSKVITKQEAIDYEIEMDKLGLVHSIFHVGVSEKGAPPLTICHCNEQTCEAAKNRVYYGINVFRKAEYVAKVDRSKCKGCKTAPCMKRCNFGGLSFDVLDNMVWVNIMRCFGCGLCRSVCPNGALKLVDRLTYPALVDEW